MTASNVAQRQMAIHLLRRGKTPTEVAGDLGRSVSWVYKWQDRFKQGGWEGLRDLSRAPKSHPNRLPEAVRQAIRQTRSELEAEAAEPDHLSYIGAQVIQSRLRHRKVKPLPCLSAIERELRAAGMTHPRKPPATPKAEYPHLRPTQPHLLMQVDIFPHYLTGGQCVSCFNAVDVVSHYPAGIQSTTKRSQDAVEFLMHAYSEVGIPVYTQVDNEGCFSGGSTHPYVLGKVLRLALLVGTELVYSPFYHPESNGTVERFHQDYHENVWNKVEMPDLTSVQRQSLSFFGNYRHSCHISGLKGRPPAECHLAMPVRKLPAGFRPLAATLPITAGKVHFIRQVNEQKKVTILNVDWDVPLAHPGQGVWATLEITLRDAKLRIYDAAPDAAKRTCLAIHPFQIKESVQPLQPCFQRARHEPRRSWARFAGRLAAQWLSTMF